MNLISGDVLDSIQRFWNAVALAYPGVEARFPRQLETAIPAALPLAIVSIRDLRGSSVNDWLAKLSVAMRDFGPDRPLRGCLVAFRGRGLVFVDSNDSPDETQLTLAHEAAHFLLHYLGPRARAVARLGPKILEVLDGLRAPRNEERLAGVLRGCPIGQYRHMMGRGQEGAIVDSDVERAETEADLVALELLAPAEAVARICRQRKGGIDEMTALEVLQTEYRIPTWGAKLQARVIIRRYGSRRSNWLEGLGNLAKNQAEP